MRLTLRTMLAYVDEILEPDDAADIGKKIEESEFATSLMHRLRDSTRRLRLGAPATLGKGLALDPNTVAEYLDNTLESERVAEFEKICLESDVHLAELASCHEVLTLVLGEPAQVDPGLREHMYQLVHSVPRTGRSETAPPPLAAQPAPPPVSKVEAPPMERVRARKKPEVPDYLRASRRSPWWSLAAVLLVGALILGGLALAAPDRVKTVIASLTGKPAPEVSDDAAKQKETSADAAPVERPVLQPVHPAADDEPKNDGAADTPIQPDTTVPAAVRFPQSDQPADDEATGDVAPAPDATNAKGTDAVDIPPLPEEISNDAATAAATIPAEVPSEDVNSAVDGDPNVAADAAPIAGLGRYLSSADVVLRLNKESGEWQRLPRSATLVAGDHLLSLPPYTPTVSLSTGISIQPIGAAEFELDAPDERGVPGLKIVFGQFNILTLGKAANPLRVSFGDRQGTVVFSSPESTIALEVRRILQPGADPEQQPAAVAADLFAMTGAISWDEEGAKSPLREPDHLPLTDLRSSELKEGDLPRWTDYKPSDFVKRGAMAVEKAIAVDRPALLSLRELSERPQEEIRSLAMQSAAYAGDFDAIVESLNDNSLTLIETIAAARTESLRSALARSPETAALVRQSFEKKYNDQGKALYRMLWGYNAEQLEAGEAAKLVGYLEDEHLPFRALSSLALQHATNLQIKYRATDPPARRKTAVKLWKDKLKEGKIVPPGGAPRATKPDTKATGRRPRGASLLESSS